MMSPHGAVAQLGERLNRTQEVRGSNPLSSTDRVSSNIRALRGANASVSQNTQAPREFNTWERRLASLAFRVSDMVLAGPCGIEAELIHIAVWSTEVLPAIAARALLKLADQLDSCGIELATCRDDVVDKESDDNAIRPELFGRLWPAPTKNLDRVTVAHDQLCESSLLDHQLQPKDVAEKGDQCLDLVNGDSDPGNSQDIHSRRIPSAK